MTLTPQDVRNVAFDKPPIGRRGYVAEQVDAFLDLVEDALAGHRPLSPLDVQSVAFDRGGALTNRGYDEDQVDAFLDLVVDALSAGEQPPSP